MTANHPQPAWAARSGHVQLSPAGAVIPAQAADRLAIAECIHRYGWGYDERNRDALGDCFTDDGIWEGSVITDLDESTAVAHAYLLLTAASEGVMAPITTGPYRLEMRRQEGVWRIARLLAGFDAPF
jgi:hypothetical protein